MSEVILSIHGLKTYFYVLRGILKAVDGINLTINKGEVVSLVGESGCGKTMTARSIINLVPSPGRIVDGNIIFKNKNLLELNEEEMRDIRGNKISMIFQDPTTYLNPVMKIGDQIAESYLLRQNISKKEAWKKAIEILEKVRMPSASEIVKRYPHELSGGMCQRVVIAIALSSNPDLLIADEPTTALDVTIQDQILNLMKDLIKDFEASLLLITHDLGIVADLCDRIYIMYAGKIVESSDIFKIFKNPKHPYTIGLLKSVLSIDEYKKELVTIDGTVPDLINPPLGCRFHPRCGLAKEICRKKEPQEIEVEPGHKVSCFLYS